MDRAFSHYSQEHHKGQCSGGSRECKYSGSKIYDLTTQQLWGIRESHLLHKKEKYKILVEHSKIGLGSNSQYPLEASRPDYEDQTKDFNEFRTWFCWPMQMSLLKAMFANSTFLHCKQTHSSNSSGFSSQLDLI